MIKNLIIRIILIILIFSSIFNLYRQLSVLVSANKSIRDLNQKIIHLEKQNQELNRVLGN
jgi:cell division protein FtsL